MAVATLILVLAVAASFVQDATVPGSVETAVQLVFLYAVAALPVSFLAGLVRALLGDAAATVDPAVAMVLLGAYVAAGAGATWRWALPRDVTA